MQSFPSRPDDASKVPATTSAADGELLLFDAESSTVLLAVIGMSPAVLTETIWALAQENPPVIPERVVVVTTTAGAEAVRRALFAPTPRFGGRSPWEALRDGLAGQGHDLAGRLRFGTTGTDVRIITSADPVSGRNAELTDLRSADDNAAAADFLLEQVRAVVENPDTRLVASIAGGRKTMGALLYACLTLVGRDSDRLTHVLVSEPFETLPEFFFPRQPGGALVDRAGIARDPGAAGIALADVPFVSLRNLFVRELGQTAGTFSRLVESCRADIRRRAAAELKLQIDSSRPELEVNGVVIKTAPLEHVVALFLATRAKTGSPPYGAYKDALDDINAFRESLAASAPTQHFADWRHASSLRECWDERALVKATSGLRRRLKTAAPPAPALAVCLPEKGRCSLELPGSMIFIKG